MYSFIYITNFYIILDVCDKVENLKDTYNAYNYASKFYQKYLHIYVDIETVDPLLFNIYLFTSNANNKDYSVTLQKNIDKKWICKFHLGIVIVFFRSITCYFSCSTENYSRNTKKSI